MQISQTPVRESRRATIAVQVALTMTVLLGMLAIVVDGGVLLAQRRQQQAAADAAAMAYALAMSAGKTTGQAQTSALAIASANGAANNGTTSKITTNATDASGKPVHGIWGFPTGPISGSFVGKAGTAGYATGYAEVVVEYDEARLFSSIWASSTLPVRARAVASWSGAIPTYFTPSILALGTTGTDITDAGTAQITVPGNIISNSSIKVTGGKAEVTSTGGKITYAGSESGSNYSPAPTFSSTTTPDPLATLSALTLRASPHKVTVSMPIHSTTTLQPGVYKGGISVTGGTVSMSPGIYYIEGGGLSISGQATVKDNGSGVLIYNGETNGATTNPGSVGAISLTGAGRPANNSHDQRHLAGDQPFQDRAATASVDIEGGNNTNITGMIYAAGSDATIAGNANVVPGTSFITKTVKVAGTSAFTIPVATVKVPIPGTGSGGTVGLVE